MRKVFFLFIFPSALFLWGQNRGNTDSLLEVLKTAKPDTAKVLLLSDMANTLLSVAEFQKSDSLCLEALNLSLRLDYKRGIGNAYFHMGRIQLSKGNARMALVLYEKAMVAFKSIGRESGIAGVLINMGLAHADMGNYSQSLECYFKALVIQERLNNKKAIAVINENVGNSYSWLKNNDKALYHFNIALDMFRSLNDSSSIGRTFSDMGSVYRARHDLQKALEFYDKALAIAEKENDIDGAASAYHNIGITYEDQGKFIPALENLQKSLAIREQMGDKEGIAGAILNIGNLYFNEGNFSKARVYLNKSLVMASEIGSLFYLCETENIFSLMCEKEQKGDEALGHYKKYIGYRDSMLNKENSEKVVRLEMNYEFDKKQRQLKAEQDKKDAVAAEEKKRIFYISLGLGILVVFTILLAWLVLRQNKLRAEQKSILLEQRLLRSQMNPHFIFNSLIAIESFIYSNEPREAGKYLAGFAKLMRLILENSREESIVLDKEIKTLGHYLELQKLRYGDKFDYTINVAEDIDTESVLVPPMLGQPAIENAIEHGIKHLQDKKGLIEVSFAKRNENLVLEITDNGVGFSKAAEFESGTQKHLSLSTTITEERIKVLNKGKALKIMMDREEIKGAGNIVNGTRIVFTLPYMEG